MFLGLTAWTGTGAAPANLRLPSAKLGVRLFFLKLLRALMITERVMLCRWYPTGGRVRSVPAGAPRLRAGYEYLLWLRSLTQRHRVISEIIARPSTRPFL